MVVTRAPVSNVVWNNVARDAGARARALDLVDAARVFALLDVTMNDGIQTSHTSKFVYGLWRPVTAIRRAGGGPERRDRTGHRPGPHSSVRRRIRRIAGNMACIGAAAATALALRVRH